MRQRYGIRQIRSMVLVVCAACVGVGAGEESMKVVGWRGDGSGHFPDAKPPLSWGLKNGQATNIAWRSEMPNYSPSSVIVVQDRLFTTSNDYDLVCVDKKSGKILWVRALSPYDAAGNEEREAHKDAFSQLDVLAKKRDELAAKIPSLPADGVFKLGTEIWNIEKEMEKILTESDKEKYKNNGTTYSDGGYMAATPASDGKFVYAWNSWGVTACYDLAGVRKWIHFEKVRPQEHGLYGSPLVVGNLLITYLGKQYRALDKNSGKEVWKSDYHKTQEDWSGYWYGSHLVTRIGSEDAVVAGDGSLVRARDGVRFLKGYCHQGAASPVVGDGFVCWMDGSGDSPLEFYAVPQKSDGPLTPAFKRSSLNIKGAGFMQASPLIVDGLIYVVGTNSVLLVYDLAADKLVYRKELDFGERPKREDRPYGCGINSSPSYAGGKIFIIGNFGTTLILEPGREYKEIGRNVVDCRFAYNYQNDMLEGTVSNPFFEGTHIFFRAQKYLYCFGEAGNWDSQTKH